jgi:signal transduction histidine kinase
VSLQVRLALAFASVALFTAAAIALVSPYVIARGFAHLEGQTVVAVSPVTDAGGGGGRQGAGGPPAGAGPAARAAQVQQDTTLTVLAVALAAAALASLAGALVAQRLVRPLRSLEEAAAAVASGELGRRSGVAERSDEVGSVGRSFDRMALELQRSQAARQRLLQDAAHELRTPLAVIEATASAVADGVYEAEPRHFATIRNQTRLMMRVVEDLRTVGLAEEGRLSLHRERWPVSDLVDAVAGDFRARARGSAIELRVRAVPGVEIFADRDRLAQALGVYLDNALRHTPAGGSVEVGARLVQVASGERIRIEVADTGPGIAQADLPWIFERFYQAHPARDHFTGSSGLGLTIARAIAEAHGGTVGAANRSAGAPSAGNASTGGSDPATPSSGATFWVELPVAPGSPSSVAVSTG